MQQTHYPCVLSIAGTDPSGGAGIQADIKAISATGSYAASIITALVAQNTQGVQAIQDVPPHFVQQQLDSVFNDLTVNAVKIGMLYDTAIIEVIATALGALKPPFIVFDPVMIAKNGSLLLKTDAIDCIKKKLLPNVYLITPNLLEAGALLNCAITTMDEMVHAAETLGQTYGINVLIKGGHLSSTQSSDVLYQSPNNTLAWFHADRIDTKHTHGTGCTLSSAIASYLAQGYSLINAISSAKSYLTQAILAGRHLNIGKGQGPVHHFYSLESI